MIPSFATISCRSAGLLRGPPGTVTQCHSVTH